MVLEKLQAAYAVVEMEKLAVADLPPSGAKPTLVLLSGLDGIADKKSDTIVTLIAYKLTDSLKGEPANNFYLDADKFYAPSAIKGQASAASIRKELSKLLKAVQQPKLATAL